MYADLFLFLLINMKLIYFNLYHLNKLKYNQFIFKILQYFVTSFHQLSFIHFLLLFFPRKKNTYLYTSILLKCLINNNTYLFFFVCLFVFHHRIHGRQKQNIQFIILSFILFIQFITIFYQNYYEFIQRNSLLHK